MTRRARTILSASFALMAMAFWACSEAADAKNGPVKNESVTATAPGGDNPATERPDRVTVYYFHNTRRCPTCLGIQKNIEEAIEQHFQQAIQAGMLSFEALNMEEAANRSLVEQFQLSFGTMVVAAKAEDRIVRWENDDKVWQYAHEPSKLQTYIRETVSTHVKMVTE